MHNFLQCFQVDIALFARWQVDKAECVNLFQRLPVHEFKLEQTDVVFYVLKLDLLILSVIRAKWLPYKDGVLHVGFSQVAVYVYYVFY